MKKEMAEEPLIEVVEDHIDVLPAPAVRLARMQKQGGKDLNPYVYKHIGNSIPWFEVLLVHPNPDLKSLDPPKNLMARLNPMVVTKLYITSVYKDACTIATSHAKFSQGNYLPVSRAGWPPNAAWVAERSSVGVYVTVDENRLRPGPYRKATQNELLARCSGEPHEIVFSLGFGNCAEGKSSIVQQDPEPDTSLNDQAKNLMQKGIVKLAESV